MLFVVELCTKDLVIKPFSQLHQRFRCRHLYVKVGSLKLPPGGLLNENPAPMSLTGENSGIFTDEELKLYPGREQALMQNHSFQTVKTATFKIWKMLPF